MPEDVSTELAKHPFDRELRVRDPQRFRAPRLMPTRGPRIMGTKMPEADTQPNLSQQESLQVRDAYREQLAAVLGAITTIQANIELANAQLDETVHLAREMGASWQAIGESAGVTHQSAHRRWSPGAKEKHAEDVRKRRER